MEKNINDIITVYAEATPNPESMKFVANKMLLPNDSADFRTKELAENSALAKALFEMSFVKGVFIMNNFVSVTKNADYEWFDLIPDLRNFFTEWLEDGKEIVAEYVQVILATQAGLELSTEANDSFETLGTNTSPDINGYFLETNGYPAAPGYNPQAMLRWSDDGGHTWSNEHWSSMGKIGQYGFRTFWRRLGMTQKLRDRVYEVSGTDAVKIAITNAELLLSPTNA